MYALLRFALPGLLLLSSVLRADPAWLPPGLPAAPAEGPALTPGAFLTEPQGKAVLDYIRMLFERNVPPSEVAFWDYVPLSLGLWFNDEQFLRRPRARRRRGEGGAAAR